MAAASRSSPAAPPRPPRPPPPPPRPPAPANASPPPLRPPRPAASCGFWLRSAFRTQVPLKTLWSAGGAGRTSPPPPQPATPTSMTAERTDRNVYIVELLADILFSLHTTMTCDAAASLRPK
ncbi:MAG TPA: hypothetical protein DCF71_02290 [Gemmatimonadetes bacterium]|nr:hypothetical protein [Gemmatimonadota bacterium]